LWVETVRVPGKFKYRVTVGKRGAAVTSDEFLLEVQFPSARTIAADPVVEARRLADWKRSSGYIDESGKKILGDNRERGGYIYLNVKTGKYRCEPWPNERILATFPDGPPRPLENEYYVAEYHCHHTWSGQWAHLREAHQPGPSQADLRGEPWGGIEVPMLLRERLKEDADVQTGWQDIFEWEGRPLRVERRATP